jgi:hypothetical protein
VLNSDDSPVYFGNGICHEDEEYAKAANPWNDEDHGDSDESGQGVENDDEEERIRRLRLLLDLLNAGELDDPAIEPLLKLSEESAGDVSRELVLLKAAAIQIALQSVTEPTARLSYEGHLRRWSEQLSEASGSDIAVLIKDRLARYSRALSQADANAEGLEKLMWVGKAFGECCNNPGGAILGLGSSAFAEMLHTAREVFKTGKTGEESNLNDLCNRLIVQCEEIVAQLGNVSDSSASLLALLLPDASELHNCAKIAADVKTSLWEIISLRFFCVDLALFSVYGQDERFETLRELHGGMWGDVFGDLSEINNQKYAEYADSITKMVEGKSYGETLGRRFTELTNGPDIVVMTTVGGFAHTILISYTKMLKRLA